MAKMRSSETGSSSVELAPGLTVPDEVTVNVSDLRGYDVEAVIVPQGGRLVVAKIEMAQREGGPPVTGEAMRQLVMTPLIKAALGFAHVKLNIRPHDEPYTLEEAMRLQEVGAVAWGLLGVEDRDRLKAAGPSGETLQWVALLYRVAVAIAEPPVKTIQGAFEISLRTATNWVAAARGEGLLEEAVDGQPG